MADEKVRLDIPIELVDKMKALMGEFPNFFEIAGRVDVTWIIDNDTIIFKMTKDGASHTIIK